MAKIINLKLNMVVPDGEDPQEYARKTLYMLQMCLDKNRRGESVWIVPWPSDPVD